jgi:CRISPR-associated protein Csm3
MPDDLRRLTSILTLQCELKALTGLHIGAQESSISIGGMDNPVVRDPLTNRPYIPGSSIKGKMRSLVERGLGLPPHARSIGQNVHIHFCDRQDTYNNCQLCQLFGIPAPQGQAYWFCLTRLRVSDVLLSDASAGELDRASTDLPYTEVKTEAAIDRVTSAATPRSMERVPAGAVFAPARFSLFRYEGDAPGLLDLFIEGMELLEADYLGGSGSRGSGRVAFQNFAIEELALPADGRSQPRRFERPFSDLAALRGALGDLRAWMTGA